MHFIHAKLHYTGGEHNYALLISVMPYGHMSEHHTCRHNTLF